MKIMEEAMVKQLDRAKGKVTAHIEVGGPGSVERSLGKARRVVDTRPKE